MQGLTLAEIEYDNKIKLIKELENGVEKNALYKRYFVKEHHFQIYNSAETRQI
jgi:hypothetical protein